MWAYSVWYTSHITKPFAKSTLEGRNKKYSWQSFAIFWHKCFIRILCQQLYIQPSGLFVPRDSSPPGISHISIPPPKWPILCRVGSKTLLTHSPYMSMRPSGVARLFWGAGRTGRHLLWAANWRKLYKNNSRENSDCKFHMCVSAIKTRRYSQRAPIVGTVGYNIGSYWDLCFIQLSSFQNRRQKGGQMSNYANDSASPPVVVRVSVNTVRVF